MKNSDITVIVQGPVQALSDRDQEDGITKQCLKSVRKYLPGSHVILATWPDQDLAGLDYDELIICDDPGRNIVGYNADASPRYENTNRQIVTTAEGLRRTNKKYALKLRSDNYLTGNSFKELQAKWPERSDELKFTEERVVIANTFSRRFYRGLRITYYVCDFFYFGLTKDLRAIWDIPHFADITYRKDQVGCEQHPGAPWPILDVDQMLAKRFLMHSYSFDIGIEHKHDLRFNARKNSDRVFANNFVVATPEQINFGLPRKFVINRQAKKSTQITYLSHAEWERLYKKYCDPKYKPATSIFKLLDTWLWRSIFIPLKFFGNIYYLTRARYRFSKALRKN